jgi:hypothetical protein
VYRTFWSPDGNFKIVVYRHPTLIAAPGGGGDAAGDVCLYAIHTGSLIEWKAIDMVQNIDQVKWSATNVDIKLFADWSLPRE